MRKDQLKGSIHYLHQSFELADGKCLQNFLDLSTQEAAMVLEWRNDPSIRKWMFNSRMVNQNEHTQFLESLSLQQERFYWMVNVKNQPIGVIDLCKYDPQQSEWGFYLNPNIRGTGLGILLVHTALEFFFRKLKIEKLYGYVFTSNINALLLHDLFHISFQHFHKFFKNGKVYCCEYRSIDRSSWMSQNVDLMQIKKRLTHKENFFHELKKGTLDREKKLNTLLLFDKN